MQLKHFQTAARDKLCMGKIVVRVTANLVILTGLRNDVPYFNQRHSLYSLPIGKMRPSKNSSKFPGWALIKQLHAVIKKYIDAGGNFPGWREYFVPDDAGLTSYA